MALTLKEAITATQTTLDVSGADAILADYIYSIGDEYILVRNMPEVATLKFGEAAYQRLTVLRGIQGTTKAAHDADAALTQVTPTSGGGGVTVDNQSDPPAEVTTLIAPGATISGDEATLAEGLSSPITTPVVVDADVAETDPAILFTHPASLSDTVGPAIRLTTPVGSTPVFSLMDVDVGAIVEINPFDADPGFVSGLIVKNGSGNDVLATPASAGDYGTLDRFILNPRGAGTKDLIRGATGPEAASGNGGGVFRVLKNGAVAIGQTSAPADNDVATGTMVLWFDQTNGAAKLMVKAKSADGTVVTGSVTLS